MSQIKWDKYFGQALGSWDKQPTPFFRIVIISHILFFAKCLSIFVVCLVLLWLRSCKIFIAILVWDTKYKIDDADKENPFRIYTHKKFQAHAETILKLWIKSFSTWNCVARWKRNGTGGCVCFFIFIVDDLWINVLANVNTTHCFRWCNRGVNHEWSQQRWNFDRRIDSKSRLTLEAKEFHFQEHITQKGESSLNRLFRCGVGFFVFFFCFSVEFQPRRVLKSEDFTRNIEPLPKL